MGAVESVLITAAVLQGLDAATSLYGKARSRFVKSGVAKPKPRKPKRKRKAKARPTAKPRRMSRAAREYLGS